MEALKEAIRREGLGIGSDIVKVDSFLNHRIDVALCTKMGQAFYQAFQGEQVDCILTVEASGIAVAITTAQAFGGIPVVFAKRAITGTWARMYTPPRYTPSPISR